MQTPAAPPAPSGRKRRRGVVTPYDFRRPTTMPREHVRALEVAFETFARQWSTLLLTRLRQPSQVVLVGVEAITYDDYVRSLPASGLLSTFLPYVGAEPGLLQLTSRSVLDCLDFLLGGPGSAAAGGEAAEREPTEIERRLLADLVERTLADLKYAFASVLPLEPRAGSTETNPQFLQLAAANDVVVVATMTLALGEDGEPEQLSVMLPMAPIVARLAEAGDRIRSGEQITAAREAAGRLARAVPNLPVEVSARFAPMPTHPPEVLSLAVGDVLRLRHPTSRPIELVVNDVLLARAVAGTNGSRLACLVVADDPRVGARSGADRSARGLPARPVKETPR